jgi:hypothetical protein
VLVDEGWRLGDPKRAGFPLLRPWGCYQKTGSGFGLSGSRTLDCRPYFFGNTPMVSRYGHVVFLSAGSSTAVVLLLNGTSLRGFSWSPVYTRIPGSLSPLFYSPCIDPA